MDVRKELLPGVGWDSFFDKEVQRVLKSRLKPTKARSSPGTFERWLAWPLIAWKILDEIVERGGETEDDDEIASLYEIDETFVTKLHRAITCFHAEPEENWSIRRWVAEVSAWVECNPGIESNYWRVSRFLFSEDSFEDVAGLVQRLADGQDPLSQALWARFSTIARKRLLNPKEHEYEKCGILVHQMNRVIQETDVANDFHRSFATNKLVISERPADKYQAWKNRQLLEGAYLLYIQRMSGPRQPREVPEREDPLPSFTAEKAWFCSDFEDPIEWSFGDVWLASYKTMAEAIESISPRRQKNQQPFSVGRIRTKEFHSEKQRRLKVLGKWTANFRARARHDDFIWLNYLERSPSRV